MGSWVRGVFHVRAHRLCCRCYSTILGGEGMCSHLLRWLSEMDEQSALQANQMQCTLANQVIRSCCGRLLVSCLSPWVAARKVMVRRR